MMQSDESNRRSIHESNPATGSAGGSDITFSKLRSSSFLEADSETSKGAITPETFFLNKFPMDQLKEESIRYARSQGDTSDFVNLWILKQIDHWNNDHEMVVALTRDVLYLVKFDFVTQRRRGDAQTIRLAGVTTVTRGNIVYPQYSVMARRQALALRIEWGRLETLTYRQKWNPLCRTLPYCVLSSHPLCAKSGSSVPTEHLDLDHFQDSFMQTLQTLNSNVTLKEEAILINSYVSIGSLVFNQSQLGFSKDRKGISF